MILNPLYASRADYTASRVMGEPVLPASGSTTEATHVQSAEPTVSSNATGATPMTTTKDASGKPNKRASVFGGLFGKKESHTAPATTETAPAVPAKDEPATVSSTAPQLDNPVPSSTDENTAPTTEPIKAGVTPAADATALTTGTTSATTPTDKRRASFFSGLGTKKEKKSAATSGDELTDGETKKQGGGFSGLLRKASRAQPKKDPKAPVTDAAEIPLPKEPAAKEGELPLTNGETTGATEGEKLEQKPEIAEGEVGSNAIAKSEERPVVEATA